MELKQLLRVFFLFLCTIGFISCSNDDRAEFQLELSKNSCEVMQGRSVTIDLTAHENTTLDIENSELIDIVYTWAMGSYKAKIEIKGKQPGETDVTITDHETGESARIRVKVTEYSMPRLAVEQSKGNIFDTMNFYLYREDSQSINSSDLAAVCDSIVWVVDGLKGSFRVFEHKEGDGWVNNHLILKWGHCFEYPGEYKTYLTTWKDNQVIFRHQLNVSATNGKDFLVYHWKDITKDSQAWGTYMDVLGSSPNLMIGHGIGGNIPFAEVRLFSSSDTQSYRVLFDYLNKLYSAPTYEDHIEKRKMWQRYDELFSEQKKYPDAYPIAIWVTERANIVLLLLDGATEDPGYLIYAEPHFDIAN